jgi:hypothetical protein
MLRSRFRLSATEGGFLRIRACISGSECERSLRHRSLLSALERDPPIPEGPAPRYRRHVANSPEYSAARDLPILRLEWCIRKRFACFWLSSFSARLPWQDPARDRADTLRIDPRLTAQDGTLHARRNVRPGALRLTTPTARGGRAACRGIVTEGSSARGQSAPASCGAILVRRRERLPARAVGMW